MREFEVWTEGYAATGEYGDATFHGKFKGVTFRDAVQAFKDTVENQRSRDLIDVDRLLFWACRFFDNEVDARKKFG